MINIFKEELKLIEGLMYLHWKFDTSYKDRVLYFKYKDKNDLINCYYCAGWWVSLLCRENNTRLPQIEEFLKHCNGDINISSFAWEAYRSYFNIK